MKPNKRIPGSRWFLYGAGLTGMAQAVDESLEERRSPSEQIDPTTPVEHRDVNAKLVFFTGLGVLLTVWAVVLVMYPLFNYFRYERTGGLEPSKVLVYVPKLPPHPRNESNPIADFEAYKARQEGALHSYYWVDRGKGVVAIPIEQAIRIVAQRGIPPSPASDEEYTPKAGTMVTGFEGKVEPEPR